MKILGIDTATKFLSLGILDDTKVYEYNIDLGVRHSILVIPTIKRVLDALGWGVEDIDYFACGLGPGSFTGMRIGLSIMKGFSWSLNKPIVGISTLDMLANNVKSNDASIAAIIDAKRGLVYCSIYKIRKGNLTRTSPYLLLTVEQLYQKIKNDTIIVGDAAGLYKEKILMNVKGVVFLDKDCWYPKGHSIVKLALEKIKAKKLNNAFKIKPIYLYPKECQIRNEKNQNTK